MEDPPPTNARLLSTMGRDLELWSPSTNTTAKAASVLSNKVVLLYFSAQWCGPCTRFTPMLQDLYTLLKQRVKAKDTAANDTATTTTTTATPPAASDTDDTSTATTPVDDDTDDTSTASTPVDDFEIVFCSLDKTRQSYHSYTAHMPWWCLPFSSTVMGTLANVYTTDTAQNGLAIPLLVVLDAYGQVVCADGVGHVTCDPQGRDFPWRPPRLVDILTGSNLTGSHKIDTDAPQPQPYYIHADGQRRELATLDDRYLLLYFGAQWCTPCQTLVPLLNAAYTTLCTERPHEFELLYVSLDRSDEAFDANCATLSFGALPYTDVATALAQRLSVRTIPQVVMLGPLTDGDRTVINPHVRSMFETDEYRTDFPYWPKRYGDLNKVMDNINSVRCVICFCELGDDDAQAAIQHVLRQVADTTDDATTRDALRLYWATAPTGLAHSVREALSLGPPSTHPLLVLLDIPQQGSYYTSPATDMTVETVLDFIAHPGERRQL